MRAVVEPVGGCVTVIAAPTSAFEPSCESHALEGALPADETGAATFVAGEPSVHGGIGSDAEERDATSIDETPAVEGTTTPEVKAEDEDQHLPPPTVLGALGVPEREDRSWPTRTTGYSGSQASALERKLSDLAQRERRGIDAIENAGRAAATAKQQATGLQRLFQVVSRRENGSMSDRSSNGGDRRQAIEGQIAALRADLQAERAAYLASQTRDRQALDERHGAENR